MRLFTAIAIPPDVTAQLVQVMDRFRGVRELRFVTPENLHLTTTFIGEWPEKRLDEMKQALSELILRGPIEIRLARLGWIPNPQLPKVLYADGFTTEPLQKLVAATTFAVVRLGAQPDARRWYRPHVTLALVEGRPRSIAPFADVGEIGTFQASSFWLYLSSGGKYTKLQEFFLRDS